jgi:hypothetical protein
MLQSRGAPAPNKRSSPRKIAAHVGLAVGVIAVVVIVAFLVFPDALVNQFLKGRNISTFEKTYPEYSMKVAGLGYDISHDRLKCDSLWLTPTDSGFSCMIVAFSVSSVGWSELLRGRALTPDFLANSDLDAKNVVLMFPRLRYEVLCERLHISVSDSEIVAEEVELHPILEDEPFFAANKFRRTRYRAKVAYARMEGSTCLGILRRNKYCGRSAQFRDLSLDILTNEDKPSQTDSVGPLMPFEAFSSIQALVQVDSLDIVNGAVKYGERKAVGAEPAAITFDSLQVSIRGIANHRCDHDSTLVQAEGRFMNAGTLHLRMSIPVAKPEFSFRYSGSLVRMRLNELNPFVTRTEHVRIKSGYLDEATFGINVTSGHANGTLRAVYSELAIAMQDDQTGSEKGVLNRVISFVANNMKIRTHNAPDKSGAMKIGVVSYNRKPDDTFFEFLWSALKSGIKDVVGS